MNKVIVSLDKFKAIVLNEKHSDLTNTNFQVDNQMIKSVLSVELLGIQRGDKLNFNLHMSKICKSVAYQSTKCINKTKIVS